MESRIEVKPYMLKVNAKELSGSCTLVTLWLLTMNGFGQISLTFDPGCSLRHPLHATRLTYPNDRSVELVSQSSHMI